MKNPDISLGEKPTPGGSPALMFPGQGSQFPGMGVDLGRESRRAGEIFERADEALGYSLSGIMAAQSGDELNRTVHTQPAVFVYSMALYEALKDYAPVTPVIAAGHSLGEYTALTVSGVFEFEQALEIIRVRAEGMDAAQPPGACGMAALLGIGKETALEIVGDCRGEEVLEVANFNAPDQTVISGHISALERAAAAAGRERRAKAVMLPVSSAFHTPLMAPAQIGLSQCLAGTTLGETAFPVVSNVDAEARTSYAGIKDLLVDQIVKPVLWVDCVQTMLNAGVHTFVEIGPGKVLTGLLRRINKDARGVNVCDIASIRNLEICRA